MTMNGVASEAAHGVEQLPLPEIRRYVENRESGVPICEAMKDLGIPHVICARKDTETYSEGNCLPMPSGMANRCRGFLTAQKGLGRGGLFPWILEVFALRDCCYYVGWVGEEGRVMHLYPCDRVDPNL
jgi:hypothetical protein